jgi:diguanylate cyclase (GGDEF)-like protein/PAS domain S-box-containing protein
MHNGWARFRSAFRYLSRSPWWVVVLVGLAATLVVFWWVRREEVGDFRARFETDSTVRARRLIYEMEESLAVMQAMAEFFQRTGYLSDRDFRQMASPFLRVREDVGSIGWVPAEGTVEQREPVERTPGLRATKDARVPYLPNHSPRHRALYPILYVESGSANTVTTGFDLGSDPELRAALEQARDTGEPAAIPWQLRKENDPLELLLLVPVYRGDFIPSQKEGRRTALRGFVLGVLRVDRLLEVLFAASRPEGLSFEFVDFSQGGRERTLHKQSVPVTAHIARWPSGLLPVHPPFLLVKSFAGREWGMRTTPGEAYVRRHHGLGYWLVLPIGMALTLLIALYRQSIVLHWVRMEMAIEQRTALLQERERNLEDLVRERTGSLRWKTAFLEAVTNASQDGIIVTDSDGKETFRNEQAAKLWKALPPGERAEAKEEDISFLDLVKGPSRFREDALAVSGRSNVCLRHEIELLNGVVLDTYSSPVLGKDGTYYGRVWMFHDVTERKRAEETLRDSENKFRDLTEKSILGIALIQDGFYRFVNAQFAAIHGTAIDEMIDREVTSAAIHPEDRGRINGHILEDPTNHHKPTEFRIVAKNGEVRTVLGYASVTTYGMKPALIATLLDITDQRQAEEAVRENEVRLSHATELARIVYWELDEATQEFIFNDAFYALYRTTAEREGGYRMTRDEYFERFLHPEDVAAVKKVSDENKANVDNEPPSSHEHRAVRKDGTVIHVTTRVKVVRGADGRVVKVIGANQDITEQKQAEEAVMWKTAFLEAQVNSSLDGILVVARQGEAILRNQRLIDMWKLPDQVAEERDARQEFTHALSMTRHPKAFREKVIFLNRHPNETSRDEVDLKDGTVLDSYSCPVLGKDGTHYGRIWTFRDITELKRYWDMLEGLSNTDGLTELANRRRFDESLDREWRRALRDRSPLSLILMDIDFFKEFNDNYGHLAGDDCLRRVAGIVHDIVRRPGDLAARYGGEEFACILADTGQRGAAALANRVRDGVKAANMPHFFSSIADHVTLSFGVATMTPEAGQSPSELIRLADNLLYAAKRNGRDQIRSRRLAIRPGRALMKQDVSPAQTASDGPMI